MNERERGEEFKLGVPGESTRAKGVKRDGYHSCNKNSQEFKAGPAI